MRKLRADPATIAHVAQTYALGRGADGTLTEAARGAMGRIWRLDLAGRTFAVKELFDQHEESAVRSEVAFTSAAADVGIGVPENLPSIDGEYLNRLPDRLGGAQVRVSSWISGRTVRPGDPGRAEWIGRTLGRLHALRRSVDGIEPDPWYETCPTAERWAELLDAGAAAGQPWVGQLRALLPRLAELGSLVTATDPAELIRCHNDPQPSNVLFDPPTGRYTLLDWENCGPAMPLGELAGCLLGWHESGGVVDVDAIRTTMRAYRAAGGADGLMDLTDFSAAMAGTLNYVEVLVRQALDGSLPAEERERAATGLDELLPNLPTLEDLTTVWRASRLFND